MAYSIAAKLRRRLSPLLRKGWRPFTDQAKKDLDTVKDQVWRLYEGLQKYKENPNPTDKKRSPLDKIL